MKTVESLENSEIIIFTDLDGTLLNHDNYSFADAIPSIEDAKKKQIKIVIVTSKTKAEVIELSKKLGLTTEPFIVENGAGIYIPKANKFELIQLGTTQKEIKDFVQKYLKNLITLFSEMSIAQANELTGLSENDLKLAQKRDFTEPFILNKNIKIEEVEKIIQENSENFKLTKGGRFYHLIGKNQDKGKAVLNLIKLFKKENLNKKIVSFALGDSKNDIPMLQTVDYPILIQKHDQTYETISFETFKSKFQGSKGWNETVRKYILDNLK